MEKPILERRERIGQYGEIVSELTPESERIWAEYLRNERLARIAIYKAQNELDKEANDKEAKT